MDVGLGRCVERLDSKDEATAKKSSLYLTSSGVIRACRNMLRAFHVDMEKICSTSRLINTPLLFVTY